jgi:hypothetical protein
LGCSWDWWRNHCNGPARQPCGECSGRRILNPAPAMVVSTPRTCNIFRWQRIYIEYEEFYYFRILPLDHFDMPIIEFRFYSTWGYRLDKISTPNSYISFQIFLSCLYNHLEKIQIIPCINSRCLRRLLANNTLVKLQEF